MLLHPMPGDDLNQGERDIQGMPREQVLERASPLVLGGLQPFARGSKRHCYVHPDNNGLCVKVLARAGDRHCHAEQKQEITDYAWLKKFGPQAAFDRIPAMEGVINTDLGVGIVSRLCRDANGGISRNLGELVKKQGLTPPLIEAIGQLKRWLREQQLLTRDTGPHNVVAVYLGRQEWKLVIIEGWVNRRFHWLTRRNRSFAGYMIDRQLRKFDRRLAKIEASSAAQKPLFPEGPPQS